MSLNRRKFVVASALVGAETLTSLTSSSAEAEKPKPTALGHLAGRSMSQTYLMPKSIEETWRAFTDPKQRVVWFGYESNPLEGAAESHPPKYMRSVIDHPGLPAPTEETVVFEPIKDGTRIIHTMGGFGNGAKWDGIMQSSAAGIDEMMSDLALYLRTGVGFPRHTGAAFPHAAPHPNALLNMGTREVPGGMEVLEVPDGSLSAELGLRPGDTIVALGDAGIFSLHDLRLANRMHAPGDVVDVTWVREGKILTGKGRMTTTAIQWRNGFDPTKVHPGPASGDTQK
jgi:hypothetical protein